ncbi:23S rRNA (uracil(1939)-C(5))-methyltransferase RlmD [Candidatus Saganbacteria bacterium]|nr:23S rRNA (uracil(1939)-C(5))-methyltransferase RlmD [Candidatus Saganbacteria bacterium]
MASAQTPACPHFGRCGGCAWQDTPYEEQLKRKMAVVQNLFGDICQTIIPSPDQYFYRNRMDYAFGKNYTLGLKANRYEIIDIKKCLLMSEQSNKIMDRLRYFVSWKKITNYREGIMRHVVIREGKNIQNTVINVLTSDAAAFPLEDLWQKNQDLIQGAVWSINLSPADRSYGEIKQSLGQDYLLESLGKIKFKIPSQSFFQTNTKQAERLIEVIRDFAGLEGEESLLDLYSGTGSFGLSLAHQAKEVIGIEENQPAVELSTSNAALNNISNFRSIAGRVEDTLPSLERKFSTIILDPPRPGVHKKALQAIGRIRPKKIVYVSCNPASQKHDIDILKEFGYKIERCQPLDMFPHTPHIENVVVLAS